MLVYPLTGRGAHQRIRQRWSTRLLAILGVTLDARGAAIQPGCMLVANHVSWLDIFAINALVPTAFVSKSEVRDWPLIGWLAARNDTVFLRRGSRGHAKIINAEIGALLDDGLNVGIFPEGTTTDGTHVLHFHAALLQPAIECGHPVQAIAIRYRTLDDRYCAAPAYDGDISLGQCVAAIVRQPGLIARIDTHTPMPTRNALRRRELAVAARDAIAAQVGAEPDAQSEIRDHHSAQALTWKTAPSSSRTAVSLPPQTQPESSAISPSRR